MPVPPLLSLPTNVIFEVLQYLLPDKSCWARRRGSPELVALATTCRRLSELALNVLWQELPSVVPLILTMPSDLIAWSPKPYKPRYGPDMPVLSFRRPLVPADYAAFVKYAVRVKAVDYYHTSGYSPLARARVTPDVWRALQAFRLMAESLPNLRNLRWSWNILFSDPQEFLGPLFLLASSTLQEVTMFYTSLAMDGTEVPLPASIVDACTDFLSRLSRNPRNLRTFRISYSGQTPPLRSQLLSLVSKTHTLTTFVSPDVALLPRAFLHLAQCTSLQTLTAKLCQADWIEEWEYVKRQLLIECFPALRDLELVMDDVGLCDSIILFVRSRELQSLSFFLAGDHSDTDVAKFLAIIPNQPFAPLLREYDLRLSLTSHLTLYAADIAPLFALDLHHVSIWGCEIAVSNELVRDMAEAWPNIVCLRLLNSTYTKSPYNVTLPGLLPFVYKCPRLEELHLEIDATNRAFPYPIPEIRPGFGAQQHALRELHPGYGLVSDPYFVAGFITDCFPECGEVMSSFRGGRFSYPDSVTQKVQSTLWNQVWLRLRYFAKVRAQERHGAEVAGLRISEPVDPDLALQCVEMAQSNPVEAGRFAFAHGLWRPRTY